MRKQEKAELVAELGEKLRTAKVTVLARYQGLSVAKTTQFRREVRGVKGECRVAKNTLAKRAFAASLQGSDAWLEGPTALVLGYDDPIAVTKVVAKWADTEGEKFTIKGGIFEGEMLEPKAVVALSKLPSKDALRAQLLGVLQAPAQKLVRLLAEPGTQFARLLNSRKEKLAPDAGTDEMDRSSND